MNRRPWLLGALAVFCTFWALGGEWVSIHREVPENHLLDAAWGLAFLAAGLLAMYRRAGNRTGPLMLAVGLTGFCGNWSNLGWPVVSSVLYLVNTVTTGCLTQLVLAYPSGRLATRYERLVVAAVYTVELGTGLAFVLSWSPRAFGCAGCLWTPAPWPDRPVADLAGRLLNLSAVVLVPMFLAALAARVRRSTPGQRRELTPLWTAAGLLAAAYLLGAFGSPDELHGFGYLMFELQLLLQLGVPVVFAFGLLSARLARGAVSDLILALQQPVPPGALAGLLARTLGDPSVRLAFHVNGTGGWIDADGAPVSLPPSGRDRAATVIERAGRPYAAVLHDPALETGTVRSAAAAAVMAIENERLHAEVRAQLAEVRASRARIVEAGDAERRRVERDLHDGAQQRLLTLALALHAARRQLSTSDTEQVSGTLRRATEELRAAIDELRELARGIHPAILTDEGLGPALQSLLDRCAVPVSLRRVPGPRLPPQVEATAYFVVSEALANVTKHAPDARATVDVVPQPAGLRVEVRDDGPGGADPYRGSGLRGLQDRVAALGGSLRVRSPDGGGTELVAWLPYPGEGPG